MARPKGIKVAQIEDALHKNYGNVSATGRALGISRQSIQKSIKRHERLQKAKYDAEETLLDLAENSLWSEVQNRNLVAIIFALKCKGKSRGWIDKPEEKINISGDKLEITWQK